MEFSDFEWPVAPGYEWVCPFPTGGGATLLTRALVGDEEIRPLPGRQSYKLPLRHRALYRDFAGCRDRSDVHAFVGRWGLLDTRPSHFLSRYLYLAERFRGLLLLVFDKDVRWGREALPSLTPVLEYFDSGLPGSAPVLQPIKLYNAMLAQLHADVATESVELRRCLNCGEPLLIGPRHRRTDAQYCGHACVVAAGRRRVPAPA